jgi:collagenase-like PrtC family protease
VKLLVNPTSYANAIDLIASGVHQISVGTHETSVRNSCNLSLKEIQKLVENKKNTEVLILVNKLFFEPEIANLEKFIINVSKLKIDGLIFADYAIPQIVDEQNIKNIKLIYNPETLVTSHGQFDFYLENNITEVSLAREIIGREVDEIIKNKGQMKIQLPVAGYSYMMLSR